MIGDWFGLDRLVQRYENTDLATTERASYYPVLSEMVVAYAPVGSGLGTFEIAYPEFATVEIFGRPRHAHNDYAQFLIESGLPGFMVIAALVFSTLLRAAMVLWRRRDPVYTGVAFAGLMTVFSYMIHSVTDFNLQIPANAASIVAILAMVWSCNVKRQYTRKKDDKLA
jgi:O-antigen ligase